MISKEGATLDEAAMALDVPAIVLERAIADYKPPFRDWLYRRSSS